MLVFLNVFIYDITNKKTNRNFVEKGLSFKTTIYFFGVTFPFLENLKIYMTNKKLWD